MKNYIGLDDLARAVSEQIESIKNAGKEQKSGFFRVAEWIGTCSHSEHNFPSHLYIPPGMGYKHVCPSCGKTQTVINNGPIC